MKAWRQFREMGVPRCPPYKCGRLIWPWQERIAQIEEWPEHHGCYHRHLVAMLAFVRSDESSGGWTGEDMYDACRYCHLSTDSFVTVLGMVRRG